MASSRAFLFLQLFLPAHLANFAIWQALAHEYNISVTQVTTKTFSSFHTCFDHQTIPDYLRLDDDWSSLGISL
jgi:hypothetical protein